MQWTECYQCWRSHIRFARKRPFTELSVTFPLHFDYHAHRESEEFFRLTGQLAQPNQDYVFSKRAAFFNGLKNKVGHIMAKASALRVNLNLQPSAHSLPRPSARNMHAHHLYALNLSHHILPP